MTKGKKKQFTGFDKSTLNKPKPSLSKFDKESTKEKDSPKRPRINKESDLPKNKISKSSTTTTSPSKTTEKDDNLVRLNKFIADAGICSRREADALIADGKVTVNGEVVKEMGRKISPTDFVKYNNKVLKRERFIYILLNKPKDAITTSSDEQGRKTVLDLIEGACNERVYPVGRLDRNTTGLLLLTNDGELTKRLTHPKYNISKTYIAEFEKGVPPEVIEQLQKGIELEDGFIKCDKIEYGDGGHNHKIVMVEIHSGKNRIVRRMFEYFEYEVKKLDRVSFAGLKKGALSRGKWRMLEKKEVGFLKMATGDRG
jgi:23S rRNA pseudouridine2605 synthase